MQEVWDREWEASDQVTFEDSEMGGEPCAHVEDEHPGRGTGKHSVSEAGVCLHSKGERGGPWAGTGVRQTGCCRGGAFTGVRGTSRE